MFYTNKYKLFKAVLLCSLLVIASCAPVHRFTRVKKIPRLYSLNYCMEDVKAPRTDLNKEPWIVYSDREKNQSYNNAGGKVKANDVDFLDPFLVIGKKKDYLRLIKYTPEVLKNGKLDYKKAEYYGWMHKSKLLLNHQSVTDIASGKKNKMLTLFADTISINDPEAFFAIDSIKLYKDPDLKSLVGTAPAYSIIYQLKKSENGNVTLVSRKPYIKAEEAENDILGWVDNSLIQNIGTGLHVNLSTVPEKSKRFFIRKGRVIPITEDIHDAGSLLAEQHQTIKFNPVSSYSRKDSLVAFKTRMVLPVFDYSNNYIFNVNGGQISHKKFREIAKSLRKINISFVFEGKEHTISQFPQLVNALQNLQPLFDQMDEAFSFRFNCVMTFDDTEKAHWPVSTELSADYSDVVNFLSDKANHKDKLQPISFSRTYPGLHHAVNMFNDHRDATNLIVLIGEKGFSENAVNYALTSKLRQNNCRILGFQVYAGEGDEYNNFVLDIENMINRYAGEMIKDKREILVSPEQIRRDNYFIRVGEIQNGYRLDFPGNSITQGALFFPQKSEILPMEILTNNIDTIIQQIRADNMQVTRYMSKAFRSVGNNRTIFDSLFIENYEIDTTRIPQKKLISSFVNETPGWYVPSKIVVLQDSINRSVDYRLMVTEGEMQELKEFVASLSKYEVEYISQAKKKKKEKRKPCNCPEDDLFIELENEDTEPILENDSVSYGNTKQEEGLTGKYAGTRKIRRHLYRSHLKPIKYCKVCKEKKRKLKRLTLAEAQYRITGAPTFTETLNAIRIKDIKKKKRVSDKELEELIEYYKKMKKELDNAQSFNSNGETYYWIDRKLFP